MLGELPKHEIDFGKTLTGAFDDVLARTEAALAREGFGVLTRIDVKATFKAKLDVDVEPFVILGACNPPLAHQALSMEPRVGVMLPCNVVVRQEGTALRVEAIEPNAMAEMFPGKGLGPVAGEASDRLRRAIASV